MARPLCSIGNRLLNSPLPNRQIARQAGVSEGTVRNRRKTLRKNPLIAPQRPKADSKEPNTSLPTPPWKQLSRSVKIRDGYKCQKCFVSDNLTVHHLKSRADNGPDDIRNLITLCKNCHDWAEEYNPSWQELTSRAISEPTQAVLRLWGRLDDNTLFAICLNQSDIRKPGADVIEIVEKLTATEIMSIHRWAKGAHIADKDVVDDVLTLVQHHTQKPTKQELAINKWIKKQQETGHSA